MLKLALKENQIALLSINSNFYSTSNNKIKDDQNKEKIYMLLLKKIDLDKESYLELKKQMFF